MAGAAAAAAASAGPPVTEYPHVHRLSCKMVQNVREPARSAAAAAAQVAAAALLEPEPMEVRSMIVLTPMHFFVYLPNGFNRCAIELVYIFAE